MTNIVPLNGEAFTENEIQSFEEQYMPVIQKYAEVVKQKKQFEKEEKKFKDELGKIMDELGIKSMDCAFVKFIRVAAGEDKMTIDLESMQDKEPELYDELLKDYPKTIKGKSAFVRFDIK